MNNRQPRVRSLSTMSAFVLAVLCVGVACSVRLLSAREAVAETSLEASRLMERASSDSEAVMAPSETVAVRAVFTPRWRAALPAVVNSQRAQVPSTLSVVTPARRTREPLADAATAEASGQSFTPETLFVRASNPKWPMRVRIISATGDNERPVLVTDTLGRQLPSADTLTVDGPVQLILPDTKLQVVIESLGGDMAITTSPITAPNGRGRWVNTLLGRKLAFSRAAGEDWGKLRVEGVGYGSSQRVP